MTVRFEGKINSAAMNRVRAAIATTPQRIYPKLQAEFTRWGRAWERAVENRFTGTDSLTSLHGRTGQLQKSLSFKVEGGSIGSLHLRCQSAGVNYTRQREYGGEIVPRNRKWLTIPLPGNRTPAGVARYQPRQLKDSFFLRTEAGGREALLLMERKPGPAARKSSGVLGKGNAIPMFLLVRKVDQPGPRSSAHKQASRLGFFDEWQKLGQDRRRGLDRLGRALGRAI